MGGEKIQAKMLTFSHIGVVASFTAEGVEVRGEIREVHHTAEGTWVHVLNLEAYRAGYFSCPEYELEHSDIIQLEDGESHG